MTAWVLIIESNSCPGNSTCCHILISSRIAFAKSAYSACGDKCAGTVPGKSFVSETFDSYLKILEAFVNNCGESCSILGGSFHLKLIAPKCQSLIFSN